MGAQEPPWIRPERSSKRFDATTSTSRGACGLRGRRATRFTRGQVLTTSKPRARATGIWRGSKVRKRSGRGSRSAAARWSASTVRSGCVAAEVGGPVEARAGRPARRAMRSQSSRTARRSASRSASKLGEPVDQHERLGEGERATRTSRGRRPWRRARPAASGRRGSGRASAAGVEREGHRQPRPRASEAVEADAGPDAARATSGAGRSCAAGQRRPGRGRRGRRASAGAAPSGSSGPSWATGRPSTVMTIRSPASARRTAAARLARSSRMPIRSIAHVRVHRCTHARLPPASGAARADCGAMNFAFTEEQEELRKHRPPVPRAASRPRPRSVALMETEEGYDPAVWTQMAEQLGLQGLIIPEEFGGSGYSYVELGVVLEEMGRALLCAPYFSHRRARRQHAAARRRRRRQEGATCPASPPARPSPRSPSPSRTASGTRAASRCDGHQERRRLDAQRHQDVRARRPHRRPDPRRRPHRRRRQPVRRRRRRRRAHPHAAVHHGPDPQAGQARVRRHAGHAHRHRRRAAGTCSSTVLDLAAVGLAAEQVGGAQKVLEMAVEYAKVRVQFGRPIGSFQAIKHKCADMLLEVESAKSAAYYAGWCAAELNDELPVGGLAGQGLLLGGLLPRRRREHPDPRWHRLHLGAPGPPVLQAGQELRAAVRRPDLPPRAARPAHRHLSRRTLARTPGRSRGPGATIAPTLVTWLSS